MQRSQLFSPTPHHHKISLLEMHCYHICIAFATVTEEFVIRTLLNSDIRKLSPDKLYANPPTKRLVDYKCAIAQMPYDMWFIFSVKLDLMYCYFSLCERCATIIITEVLCASWSWLSWETVHTHGIIWNHRYFF